MTGEKAFEYSDFYDFEDDSDDEDNYEIDEGNAGEMVLASGAVVGHRSLWKYYKQSFDPRMALVPSKRANQINRYRFEKLVEKIFVFRKVVFLGKKQFRFSKNSFS